MAGSAAGSGTQIGSSSHILRHGSDRASHHRGVALIGGAGSPGVTGRPKDIDVEREPAQKLELQLADGRHPGGPNEDLFFDLADRGGLGRLSGFESAARGADLPASQPPVFFDQEDPLAPDHE